MNFFILMEQGLLLSESIYIIYMDLVEIIDYLIFSEMKSL